MKTASENIEKTEKPPRAKKGEIVRKPTCPCCSQVLPSNRQLTGNQVQEIRRLAAKGEKQIWLAMTFNTTPTTISKIVRRITWKDTPDLPLENNEKEE